MPNETQMHSTAILNDQRLRRESNGPLVDPGGNLVTDDAAMATLLSNHFASVFTVENMDELPRLDAAQADAADHAGATLVTVQFILFRRSWASLRQKNVCQPTLLTFPLGRWQLPRFRMSGSLPT